MPVGIGIWRIDGAARRLDPMPRPLEAMLDPEEAPRSLSVPVLENDPWVYRIVVVALGSAILIAVIGATYLQAIGADEIPPLLTAIGSGAVGALAGLLAPQPQRIVRGKG